MGLLLSILVACVGVAELVAFYGNVRRTLVARNEREDLENIALNYRRMLGNEYRQILAEINGNVVEGRCSGRIDTNFALSTSPKIIFNDPLDDATSCNVDPKGEVTPCSSNSVPKTIDASNSISFDSTEGTGDAIKCADSESEKVAELNPKNIDNDNFYVVHGRRSSSPFPTYEMLAPRGSVCTELLENPTISVSEVDEGDFEEDQPPDMKNIDAVLELGDHNRTAYWRKSRSRSRTRSRSKSPTIEGHSSVLYHRCPSRSPSRERSRSKSPDCVTNHLIESERLASTSTQQLTNRPVDSAPSGLCPIAPNDYTPSLRRRRSKSFNNRDTFTSNTIQKSTSNSELATEDHRRLPSPSRDFQSKILPGAIDEDILDGIKDRNGGRKSEFRRKRNRTTPTPTSPNFDPLLNNENVVCQRTLVYRSEERTQIISTLDDCKPSTSKDASRSNKVSAPQSDKKQPEPFWVNQNR